MRARPPLPLSIVREGNRRAIYIGRKINGEIELMEGADKEHPVMVSNSKYWMGPDIIAAFGHSRLRFICGFRVETQLTT